MKSDDLSNVVAPKSSTMAAAVVASVDESSVSSAASSRSSGGAADADSSSNAVITGGSLQTSSFGIGGGVGLSTVLSLSASSLEGTRGLSLLGVPQPAHQASSVIVARALASFDGIHSGVPTKTTATLTPTTLKTIEQTFMELSSETANNIPCQAGFVPPPFQFDDHSQDRENSRESMSSGSNSDSWQVTPPPIISEDLDSKSSGTSFDTAPHGLPTGPLSNLIQQSSGVNTIVTAPTTSKSSRRNMGGRRPTKASNLSPEEEEKRRVRRERNKMAAARCRRRREDHTNELVDETDQLEKKKQALQDEIKQLQQEKEDLEFLLESHRDHCRFRGNRSPLERKPVELIQQRHVAAPADLKITAPVKIKAEPEELPEQPPAKKLILSNALSDSLDTPTPSNIVPVLTSANLPKVMFTHGLVTPTVVAGRPERPASLDVKSSATFPLLNVRNISLDTGVGISTPSSGLFNFDSLMDGGTGLTPIAAPISLQSNRGPLDLITPTSTEPSKLCSL